MTNAKGPFPHSAKTKIIIVIIKLTLALGTYLCDYLLHTAASQDARQPTSPGTTWLCKPYYNNKIISEIKILHAYEMRFPTTLHTILQCPVAVLTFVFNYFMHITMQQTRSRSSERSLYHRRRVMVKLVVLLRCWAPSYLYLPTFLWLGFFILIHVRTYVYLSLGPFIIIFACKCSLASATLTLTVHATLHHTTLLSRTEQKRCCFLQVATRTLCTAYLSRIQ